MKPSRLKPFNSYAVYYGQAGEEILSRFDLAIVDPGGRSPAGVQRLKERGAAALAYVSALEVPRRPDTGPPGNVLIHNGRPASNEEFNNWVLDPRLPPTRRRFLDLAERALALGFDGIFVDTIGDVEDHRFPPELSGELLPAAAWLVAETARQHPNCVLVQNWGLFGLLPLTVHHLDGVCWEDFPFRQIGPLPSLHPGIRRLNSLQNRTSLRVLALNQGITDPSDRLRAVETAERCGFIWYGTSNYLELPQFIPE